VITPIRCGVDTLEATFSGEVEFWAGKELAKRKAAAQSKNTPEPIRMCDENLFVGAQGMGFWQYVMRNTDLMLRLSLAKNIPPMSVRLLAQGLASRGVDALWAKSKELGSEMALSRNNLTRIDVAADFQGWVPTFDEMRYAVCKSGFRPVYPNTVSPETFQFGKGEVVVRLYDKTKEVAAKNHGWWHNVWKLHGYDPSLPVWRLEVQLRSAALKELGARNTDHALEDIYGLFSYGLDWCSLRVPATDSNLRRAPEHPAWLDLREKFAPANVLGRIRPVVQCMDYDAAVARMAGLYAAAAVSAEIADYDQLCEALSLDVRRHVHNRREMSWDEFVEDKRRKMESGE
jgi:hypothetical protein